MDANGLKKVLTRYDLGEPIDYTCIVREIPQCQRCYHLKTRKGDYFIKRYESINRSKRASFDVMDHLHKKDYPTVIFLPTKTGQPFVRQVRRGWAVFEYLHQVEQHKTTRTESREIGKWLARLHTLTVDLALHPSDELSRFRSSFAQHKHKVDQAPDGMKPCFTYIESNIDNLDPPPTTFQAVCHGEFILQHLRFEDQKVIKVIDWDNVGRDFAILDIGTTLSDALVTGRIDFEMMRGILEGYERERRLTDWEREHLFEALQFGAFKFAIWALEDIEGLGWARFARRLSAIIGCGRTKFYDNLGIGTA